MKREELEERDYDLKAMNPNKQVVVDTRTPEELLGIIEAKGEEIWWLRGASSAFVALRVPLRYAKGRVAPCAVLP